MQATLLNNLHGEFNTSFDQLKTGIAADTDRKLAGVDTIVGNRLDDRLPGAIASAISDVKTFVATTADQVRTDAAAAADKLAKSAADAVSKDLGGRIDGVAAGIATNVKSVLDTELPSRLDKLTSSISAAQSDLTAAATQIKTLSDGLQSVRNDVAANALKDDAAVKTARTDLLAEMDKRGVVAAQKSASDLKDLETRLNTRIDQRTVTKLDELNAANQAAMTQTATDAANAAVKSATVQLRADMTTIAKDQALALQDQVRAPAPPPTPPRARAANGAAPGGPLPRRPLWMECTVSLEARSNPVDRVKQMK